MTRKLDTFHPQRGIFTIHCVCHRLALIVTDAFKGTKDIEQVVPNECLELLTAVFNYFGKSVKRKKNYGSFWKKSMNLSDKTGICYKGKADGVLLVMSIEIQMKSYSAYLQRWRSSKSYLRRVVLTRWLSSREAIKVIVTSRETYKNFFAEETSAKGQEIYDLLHDHIIVC
jgi:hypothetical protein